MQIRFCGIEQQRQYEGWLRTFPRAVLLEIQPVAEMARGETREIADSERDIKVLMQRPHIKAAIDLGKKHPLVLAFNRLVLQLNTKRLEAMRTGDAEALRVAQEPLTDLGRALKTVLTAEA
jgi:hypothetical protein